MVKRRRTSRPANWSQSRTKKPRKTKKSPRSFKERILSIAIVGLVLINLTLIVSIFSDILFSSREIPASMNEEPQSTDEVITVEVLNACGVQGLANEIAQYLRHKNFDVMSVGNYKSFDLDKTLVLDRESVRRKYAKKVAKALGVNDRQVVEQIDSSLQLKVTVIIGKDYRNLKVYDAIRKSQ
ncbi:MAG: LytR family transcriptional regulator [Calditrichaeota bacterium]|nr:MAG: LytR family transcriptional regulator [Calditrichota bacterium]